LKTALACTAVDKAQVEGRTAERIKDDIMQYFETDTLW